MYSIVMTMNLRQSVPGASRVWVEFAVPPVVHVRPLKGGEAVPRKVTKVSLSEINMSVVVTNPRYSFLEFTRDPKTAEIAPEVELSLLPKVSSGSGVVFPILSSHFDPTATGYTDEGLDIILTPGELLILEVVATTPHEVLQAAGTLGLDFEVEE